MIASIYSRLILAAQAAAFCILAPATGYPQTDTDGFQSQVVVPFAPQNGSGSAMISVPAGMTLVGKTVTMYRQAGEGPLEGYVTVFIAPTFHGTGGIAVALPAVGPLPGPYPGVTINADFFAKSGRSISVSAFRTDAVNAETVQVTVIGHLIKSR